MPSVPSALRPRTPQPTEFGPARRKPRANGMTASGVSGWYPKPAVNRIISDWGVQFAAEQFHARLCPNNATRLSTIVALAGEESVSGVTGGSGPRDQPGEPTHAHLHHRQ